MGFSFETLQKVLTFAHTLAEIAQLVEHQLPKLRAAGSNPVFRSKANWMMPNGHHFFCARTGPLQTCLHKGLDGQQKRLCAAQRFAFWSPRRGARECRRPNPASGKHPEGQIPLHTGNPGGTPSPSLVPAIHRGHLPPPENSPAKGTAHGELQEPINAINPLRKFILQQ